MNQFERKVKRVTPLLRVRRVQLDREAAVLAEVREDKLKALTELQRNQKEYWAGIEQLNKERAAANVAVLPTLERSVDHLKMLWYQSFKKVQEAEKREKAQLSQVMAAQQNLKTMEKLEERYKSQALHHELRTEQKALDENALRKYLDQNAK